MQSDLNILFWNIGKTFTTKKLNLISEAIKNEAPDIFCIAEGGKKDDIKKIVNEFQKNNYYCYYSPLFSTDKKLKLGYRFQQLGLKIFIRDKKILKYTFWYDAQREKGRIVLLKISYNFKSINVIFLHNKSKSGANSETLEQISFISNLPDMLKIGGVLKNNERVIIVGDFNLEPWDRVLKHKKFLNTSFFPTNNSIKIRKNNSRHFYNPIVKYISNSSTINLGGSYFGSRYNWALFDYVLYETKNVNLEFSIKSKFSNGRYLIKDDDKIKSSFIKYNLDHLPISIKVTN